MGLLQNALRCKLCDTIIVSLTVHDFQKCECGQVMVDGGREYAKFSGKEEDIEQLYLWDESTNKDFENKLIWGTRGRDGNGPLIFMLVKDLETSHIESIVKNQIQISSMYKSVFKSELRRRKITNI
jgi:hypothetical protein